MSAPSTRNSISRVEASAGNVKVTRGTNGCHAGLVDAEHPALGLVKRRRVRKQRCGMAVTAQSHQHQVEHRPRRIEPISAVKCFQIVLVVPRCAFGIGSVGRYGMDILPRRAHAVEKHPSRRPHIAERIAFRDETVVADEPVHTVPRHFAAPGLFGQQTVKPLRARSAGQRDSGAVLSDDLLDETACSGFRQGRGVVDNDHVWRRSGVHGDTHAIGRQRRPSRASSSSASLGPSLPAR